MVRTAIADIENGAYWHDDIENGAYWHD
jgi:hypothetical protein